MLYTLSVAAFPVLWRDVYRDRLNPSTLGAADAFKPFSLSTFTP